MANHLWIYPTKNQEEFFNVKKIMPLLIKEFSQFDFYYAEPQSDKYSIVVRTDKIDFLFDMYLWGELISVDDHTSYRTELIDSLDKKDEDLGDKILSDLEDKGKLFCIEIRRTSYHNEINLITGWMRQYFQAIMIDEGIYPDIILPIPDTEDYKPKAKQGIIKKFGQWLSK
jgi:uncharacterized protein YuzE